MGKTLINEKNGYSASFHVLFKNGHQRSTIRYVYINFSNYKPINQIID